MTAYTKRYPRIASGVIKLEEINESLFVPVSVPSPRNSDANIAEYYCTKRDCVVRQVEISVRLKGTARPQFKCPACSSLLQFHHFVEHEVYYPCEESA